MGSAVVEERDRGVRRGRARPDTAAEAHEALGRVYTFKGWQQESAFPGWHDEPAYRDKALAELKAAVAADPDRASAQEALRIARGVRRRGQGRSRAAAARDQGARREAASGRGTDAPIATIVAASRRGRRRRRIRRHISPARRLLIDRGEYDRAIALADAGRPRPTISSTKTSAPIR